MNLWRDLPDASGGEITETILATPALRILRITSLGQASPAGFWYDQPEAEWVALLAGAAALRGRTRGPPARPWRLPGDRGAPAPSGRVDRSGAAHRVARGVSSRLSPVSLGAYRRAVFRPVASRNTRVT